MVEHVFRVRKYQRPLHEAWVSGGKKRLIEIAHRRWGKDEIALNVTRDLALQRPATYWHCLPEYAQARKAIWTMVNPHTGKRRIEEAFPPEIVKRRQEQEMFIELNNGSTWQCIGSDRYDATVGSSPAGIVYSEWAISNPNAWAYHRPMVTENNGWAAFITTPRGNNHAKSMYDMAKDNPNWFAEVSSVADTKALDAAQLEEALAEYQALWGQDLGCAIFEQEYLCSFAGAMVGAYWGAEMARAEREGRVTTVEVDPKHPVHTAWDLGKAVNNPIWCFQVIGDDLRVVDFYRPETEDIEDWVAWLNERDYKGNDYVPHDIMVTEWGTGRTRYDVLKKLGRRPIRVARVSLADGIQAGRRAINEAVFDRDRCELGVDGLKSYRREWDEELKTFRENPLKDWAEHIGSAWRYLGLAWREVRQPEPKKEKPKELVYAVDDTGRIKANMSVREAVEAMRKRKQRD